MAAQIRAVASSIYGIIRVMNLWCINYVGLVDKCLQNFGVSPLKKGSFRRLSLNWRIILRWKDWSKTEVIVGVGSTWKMFRIVSIYAHCISGVGVQGPAAEMCWSSQQPRSCGHGFVPIVLWLKILVWNSHSLIYVARGDSQPHELRTMQWEVSSWSTVVKVRARLADCSLCKQHPPTTQPNTNHKFEEQRTVPRICVCQATALILSVSIFCSSTSARTVDERNCYICHRRASYTKFTQKCTKSEQNYKAISSIRVFLFLKIIKRFWFFFCMT